MILYKRGFVIVGELLLMPSRLTPTHPEGNETLLPSVTELPHELRITVNEVRFRLTVSDRLPEYPSLASIFIVMADGTVLNIASHGVNTPLEEGYICK